MIEIRDVPGFLGYGASADGRVWSRRTPHGLVHEWHELHPSLNSEGYRIVTLGRGSRKKRTSRIVSRLVYIAFHGPLPTEIQVDHIDFNKKENNSLSNLRPLTGAQNRAHSCAHGRQARGESHGATKLSDNDVLEIRAIYRKGVRGFGAPTLANKYGVDQGSIRWALYHRKEIS